MKDMHTPIQGSWTSGSISGTSDHASYLNSSKTKGTKDGLVYPFQYQRSESDGSYFEMYKKKMKKMKAAGLHADTSMLNSISGPSELQARLQNSHLPNKKGAVRPTHFVGDLLATSGAGIKSLSPVANGHLSVLSPADDRGRLSYSWSGTEKELRLMQNEGADSAPVSLSKCNF